ncbi:hypothetical protein [Microbacterium sp. NPDC087665]|uniref:hypothetical protein n=1 Tax=Microbacterium sp. NPDC087665 TaxID=3364194 RepID=UPI00380C22ED
MKLKKHAPPIAVALVGVAALSGCAASASSVEAKSIEVVVPDTLTVPGSSVAIGETLRVPGMAYTDGSTAPRIEPAELGLTVTDISWPGKALFDEFDNGDEFADYEPVAVAYQVDSPADEKRVGFSLGDFYGVLSDGQYADQLQGDCGFESGGIGRDLDEICYEGELPDPWTSELYCTVILVPDGQTLDFLGWNALGYNESNHFSADDPRSPYVSAPLIFKVSKP